MQIKEKKKNVGEREGITQKKLTNMAAQSDYVLTYTGKFGGHGITLTGGMTTNYNEYSSLDAQQKPETGRRHQHWRE